MYDVWIELRILLFVIVAVVVVAVLFVCLFVCLFVFKHFHIFYFFNLEVYTFACAYGKSFVIVILVFLVLFFLLLDVSETDCQELFRLCFIICYSGIVRP